MLILSVSFFIIITTVKPEHRKSILLNKTLKLYKNVTQMNIYIFFYQSLILLRLVWFEPFI